MRTKRVRNTHGIECVRITINTELDMYDCLQVRCVLDKPTSYVAAISLISLGIWTICRGLKFGMSQATKLSRVVLCCSPWLL
jgi:hypothetical protein